MSVAIYISSTARVTVSDIVDFDGVTVVASGVTGIIYDKNDKQVATVTLADQGLGVWQGSFLPLALTKDATYSLEIITTTVDSAVLTQRELFKARYKGWS